MRLDSFRIKIVLLLPFMLMTHTYISAQSQSQNYIQTKTFLDEDGLTFLRHIDYYNGLGVVLETVDVGCNTTQTPIITRTDYNSLLKPRFQWIPVPANGLDYLDQDEVDDAICSVSDEAIVYGTNEYDDFQQLISSRKPGDAWEEHRVTMNRLAVPAEVVKKYTIDTNDNLRYDSLFYQYGMLMSTTTTDEDGKTITTYTNVHGNTVLERRGTGTDATDTYYV